MLIKFVVVGDTAFNQIITNLEPSTGDSWPLFGDQVDSYISVSALSENGKFCLGTILNFYFIFISFFRKAVIVNRQKSLSCYLKEYHLLHIFNKSQQPSYINNSDTIKQLEFKKNKHWGITFFPFWTL